MKWFLYSPQQLTLRLLDYFYIDQKATPVDYPELAFAYQDKIIDFIHGKDIHWPVYGAEKQMYNITSMFGNTTVSREQQERCNLINSVVLDSENGA